MGKRKQDGRINSMHGISFTTGEIELGRGEKGRRGSEIDRTYKPSFSVMSG